MTARGPDGAGAWIADDKAVGFGHRRLAIIDLTEAGAQPMASADGSLVVTFNGEIYNYREIRQRLEAKGRKFRSNSDTEVLLHLYAERGKDMVHELRGMFAFAIWDSAEKRLFLARDPLGMKPLYYADDGWTFRFASQVKALRFGAHLSGDPDPAGCVGYYLWGSVPEPYTTLRAVRSVPAGCHMIVDRVGSHEPVRFHSVAETYRRAERTRVDVEEAQETLRAALLESVRYHLVSDVPVGVFLSAGVDSGALVGLMRDSGHEHVKSVTLSFAEFEGSMHDESKVAAEVAKLYGCQHTNYVVTRREFEDDLPRILDAMDQPSIDGINSWFVSKAAWSQGLKVALSGLGGDELFGGYPSFKDIPSWVRWMWLPSRLPGAGPASQHALAMLTRVMPLFNPKLTGMLRLGGSYPGAYLLRRGIYLPWEVSGLLERDFVKEGLRRIGLDGGARQAFEPQPRSPFARVAALETQLYMRNQLLRDADWASMAHSLEVRMPLVDATLLEKVAPLVVSGAIQNGKQALGMTPSTPLPQSVLDRPKTGFSTPIAEWQRSVAEVARSPVRATPQAGEPWARRWARYVASRQAA